MDHGNPTVESGEVWFCSDEHVTFAPRRAACASATGCCVWPAHVDPTVAYHECMHLADGPALDADVDRAVAGRPARLGRRCVATANAEAIPCPADGRLNSRASTPPPKPSSSARGDASPIELVDAAIDAHREAERRAERGDPPAVRPGPRRGRAATLPDGPFRGVPIVVKDLDGTLAGAPYHDGQPRC